MHICHVSPHLPPDQAANALLPAQLGRWAAARGDQVTFIAHEPAQGGTLREDLPGRVRRLPNRRSSSWLARTSRFAAWSRARAVMTALDALAASATLLHLHSNGLIIEVAAAWARRRQRPYVLTLYGTEIWHYRPRWPIDPFTRAYRGASAVTFYSRRLEARARSLGLGRPGMSVIYPPVSPAFRPADARTRAATRAAFGVREPFVILNVKRLHELAGQTYLIDAFARVARRRRDVRLVMCGTGPLRQDLQAQAAAAGIGGKVTFTGLVANDTVARWAAVADVFALPSLLEAMPTVAVEALAAGTPVVSADHPGGLELHDLFGDDVRVVPTTNVDRLADALNDAIDHPRRTHPATATALATQFSPAAVEAAYWALYGQVVGKR
jgi:glycosyltransferase involved in cell wall biosynthesis